MSNYNQNDNRSGSSAADQFEQSLGASGQGYTDAPAKRPINRNLVVLLLIAAVGASLIYLMYLRSRFDADRQTPDQVLKTQAVSSFMSEKGNIDTMQEQLARTERQVSLFQQDNSEVQVAVADLKINPFTFGEPKVPHISETRDQELDPAESARLAIGKTKVQMIMYSSRNSSVTINNFLYKTGDQVLIDNIPFTVKSISANKVVLSNPMGDFALETAGAAGM